MLNTQKKLEGTNGHLDSKVNYPAQLYYYFFCRTTVFDKASDDSSER